MYSHHRGLILILLILVTCQSLFGCLIVGEPISEQVNQLEGKYDLIVQDKTDRKTVIEILGEPIISSRNLKFDIFRRTASRSEFALLPLPPFAFGFSSNGDTIHIYTIVEYNSHDIVLEFSFTRYYSGIIYDPFRWISTKNIKFIVTGNSKNDGVILHNLYSINEYIKEKFSKNLCIIVTGCESECNESIIIDGKEISLWPNSIIMSEESPGEKRIDISSSICNKSHSLDYTCKDGDIYYFTAKCQTDIQGDTDLVIDKNDKIPNEFINGPVQIWRDGTWLIDKY